MQDTVQLSEQLSAAISLAATYNDGVVQKLQDDKSSAEDNLHKRQSEMKKRFQTSLKALNERKAEV